VAEEEGFVSFDIGERVAGAEKLRIDSGVIMSRK
jgi:hypothetical protein